MQSLKIFILSIFTILLVTNCTQNKNAKVTWVQASSKSKDIDISEEKLVNLLADMHFAKAASLVYPAEKQDSMHTIYSSQVFEVQGISSDEYYTIVQILESDLNLYHDIEKKVHLEIKRINDDKSEALDKKVKAKSKSNSKSVTTMKK